MAVLDASFLIGLERKDDSALRRLQQLEAERQHLRIPASVWVEYLYRKNERDRAVEARKMERAATFEPFTREQADGAARIQAGLATRGATLTWHDLQVAAVALHYGEPLVTNDTAFDRVPGLRVLRH